MKTIITTICLIFLLSGSANSQNWYLAGETLIGQTLFGMQTERSMPRLIASNGTSLSACWTTMPSPGWSTQRNIAYCNIVAGLGVVSDTNNLQPKITSNPNVESCNGWEYILANSVDSGMFLSKRLVGNGAWTTVPVATYNLFPAQQDNWSRMAVGGINGQTVHVIANSQGTDTIPVLNQNGPMTYSRSPDRGVTWDIDHLRMPDSDESFYLGFSRGNYAIDCRGDVVVIVAGGFNMELCLWKSIDNGNTWTKTIVFPFPVLLYDDKLMMLDPDNDGVADTVETSGQDPTVILDANGIAHVAFGRMRIYDGSISGKAVYDPLADGLYYWNETMAAPAIVAIAEDLNGNGVIDIPQTVLPNTIPVGAYFSGLLMQPSLASDSIGDIFIVYSAVNEMTDTSIFQCIHKHIYIIGSGNMGSTWTTPFNLVPMSDVGGDGEFQEAVFGAIPKRIEVIGNCFNMNIIYFRDGAPYFALEGSPSAPGLNQEIWNEDANGIPVAVDVIYAAIGCINGIGEHRINPFSISPNPANNLITVSGFGNDENAVSVSFFTPDGKVVKEKNFHQSKTVRLDVSDLIPGIYIVRITTEKQVQSVKLVRSY
ncbi:MAG: T9SS type A sorting domain-containing protein [Bacteroidota bacterium]